MEPTQEQIDDQINLTLAAVESGVSAYPGMTYEQGVDNALRWANGDTDDPPMEDE